MQWHTFFIFHHNERNNFGVERLFFFDFKNLSCSASFDGSESNRDERQSWRIDINLQQDPENM
jgi:hypothetical protein